MKNAGKIGNERMNRDLNTAQQRALPAGICKQTIALGDGPHDLGDRGTADLAFQLLLI